MSDLLLVVVGIEVLGLLILCSLIDVFGLIISTIKSAWDSSRE